MVAQLRVCCPFSHLTNNNKTLQGSPKRFNDRRSMFYGLDALLTILTEMETYGLIFSNLSVDSTPSIMDITPQCQDFTMPVTKTSKKRTLFIHICMQVIDLTLWILNTANHGIDVEVYSEVTRHAVHYNLSSEFQAAKHHWVLCGNTTGCNNVDSRPQQHNIVVYWRICETHMHKQAIISSTTALQLNTKCSLNSTRVTIPLYHPYPFSVSLSVNVIFSLA